eukprot:1834643-Pyramimonas_sp.AAC.1
MEPGLGTRCLSLTNSRPPQSFSSASSHRVASARAEHGAPRARGPRAEPLGTRICRPGAD